MQNSIWKLVSLAGVVGVCFLLVLMAQNGLKQGEQDVADSALSPPGPDANHGALATTNAKSPNDWNSGDILWEPGSVQEEPPVNNEPAIVDPFLADLSNSEPIASSSEVSNYPTTNLAADLFPSDISPTLPEATIPELSTVPLPESSFAANDPFGEKLPNSFDPVNSGGEPFAAPPADFPIADEPSIAAGNSDMRPAALRLLAESYQAIDEDELMVARDKAVAAGKLPVAWAPFEESPAGLVARIDDMLKIARSQNAADATAEPLPFPGEILTVSGQTTVPTEEPASPRVKEFAADPFASELPTGTDSLPVIDLPSTIDLPLIAESPPEFVPVNSPLPQPAEPAEFPSVDIPLVDLNPVVELNPNLESLPAITGFASDPAPAVQSAGPIASDSPLTNSAIAHKPEVTIRKVAPAEATIGEPLVYSIEISNNGDSNAAEVVVEDRIPLGCKLVGTIPQAELIGSKILWRLGRLPAQSEKKLLIKVIPLEEGEIGSVATVNFVAEVSTSTSVRQAAVPEIKLDVSSQKTAKVGENVLFRFRVANEGGADARNVTLQDIVPVGFEHPAGSDVTYEIGDLPAGKSVDIDLELKAVKPGQHLNRAIVKSGKNSTVETAAAVDVVEDKGLIVQTPPSRPQPVGQKTSHEIRVTNESSQPIVGAAVNVILPPELTFVSASENGTFTKATNSIRWNLPVIQPAETVTLSTTVVPRTYGVHSSRVQLIQPDQPMEQSDSLVEASGIAALRLTLDDAPATVLPGEDFTVDFTVVNRGTGPDSNVQFSLVLPPEIEFVTARGPVRDLPPKAIEGGRAIGFVSIPEIGERASVDFQVTLRSRNAGRPKIRAEVRSDQLTDAVATEAAIVILDTTP